VTSKDFYEISSILFSVVHEIIKKKIKTFQLSIYQTISINSRNVFNVRKLFTEINAEINELSDNMHHVATSQAFGFTAILAINRMVPWVNAWVSDFLMGHPWPTR
jgi:hypothetical protein